MSTNNTLQCYSIMPSSLFLGWAGKDCRLRRHSVVKRSDSCNLACENGGSCVPNGSDPYCICPKAFLGEFCELDRDECLEAESKDPPNYMCFNGGVCFNRHGSFECMCPAFVGGKYCETTVSQSLFASMFHASNISIIHWCCNKETLLYVP